MLARDNSDGSIVPYSSAVTGAGQDHIVGILYRPITDLAIAGVIEDMDYVIGGEVREDKVIFVNDPTDTLDSVNVVTTLVHRDDMRRVGIKAKVVDELYNPDN